MFIISGRLVAQLFRITVSSGLATGWSEGSIPGRPDRYVQIVQEVMVNMEEYQDRYICTVCQWVYDPTVGDPSEGIGPGVRFEDLPEDWVCPVCGAGKDEFVRMDPSE